MSNKNDYGSLKVVRDGKRFSCVGFFIQRVKSLCCYVGEEVMLCMLLMMVNEVESRRKPRWKKKLKKNLSCLLMCELACGGYQWREYF